MKLRTKIAIALTSLLVPGVSIGGDPRGQSALSDPSPHAPAAASANQAHAAAPARITSDEALQQLKDGNVRFQSASTEGPNRDQSRRCDTFANGQHPIAAVLSCADSRAPVELILDQGIGDVFSVRVAGNVADTDEIGTIEYGVEHLHIPLIVVLGHSKCGAVSAVVDGAKVSKNIEALVDNIVPAVKSVRDRYPTLKREGIIVQSIRANVQQSMADLQSRSEIIAGAVKSGHVKIVGGVYDLHSGSIEWLGEASTQATAPAPTNSHSDPNTAQQGKTQDGHAATSHEQRSAAEMPTLPSSKPDNMIALGSCLAGGMVLSAITMKFVRLPAKSAD